MLTIFPRLPASVFRLVRVSSLLILIFAPFALDVRADGPSLRQVSELIRREEFGQAFNLLDRLPKNEKDKDAANRVTYLRGTCKMGINDWEGARSDFLSIRSDYPVLNDYVEMDLILCEYNLGRHRDTIKRAYAFHSDQPDSLLLARVRLIMAKSYLALKEWKNAAALLHGMIKADKRAKNGSEVFLLFHEALTGQGKAKDAYRALLNLRYVFPNSPEANQAWEDMKALQKRYPRTAYPKPTPDMITRRLNRLADKGRYKLVLKESRTLLKDPGLSRRLQQKIYRLRGRCYRSLKEYGMAIGTYRIYLKKFPKGAGVAETLYQIARIQWNQGRLNQALKTGKALIQKHPRDPWAARVYMIMGGVMENKGDLEQAIKYYEKAQKTAKGDITAEKAGWKIAWSRYLQNNYKKALAQLKKMTGRYPLSRSRGRTLFWAARCADRLKRPDDAARFLTELDKTDPFGFYGLLGRATHGGKDKYALFFKSTHRERVNPPILRLSALGGPLKAPNLSHKAAYHHARSLELSKIFFTREAEEELRMVYKEIDKRKLDDILWVGNLYYKAGAYTSLLKLLNHFLITVPPKERADLAPLFWDFFYPPVYNEQVNRYSAVNGVDPYFTLALIRQESSFDHEAVSSAGAIGLMQLMPDTGKRVFKRARKGEKFTNSLLYDPGCNIDLGTFHLSELIRKNGGRLIDVLAGYNAGAKVVSKWRKRFKGHEGEEFIELIPYGETRRYVKKVLRNFHNYKRLYSKGHF